MVVCCLLCFAFSFGVWCLIVVLLLGLGGVFGCLDRFVVFAVVRGWFCGWGGWVCV